MYLKCLDYMCAYLNFAVESSSELRLAKVKVDANFTAPCNTSILYPADGGNMHCFTAVTACAVLDILGPPYSDPLGRPCTYYHNYPFSKFSGIHLFGHIFIQIKNILFLKVNCCNFSNFNLYLVLPLILVIRLI